MKKKKLKGVIALCLLGSILLSGCGGTTTSEVETPVTEVEEVTSETTEDYIASLTPATDYYGYINAAALMNMELEDNKQAISTLGLINEETRDRIEAIINDIANSDEEFPKGSNEQLIHDLYWQTYQALGDKKSTEESDTVFLKGMFDLINSAQNSEEMLDVCHDLSKDYGVPPFIVAYATQNQYDTSENILELYFYPLADLAEIKESDLKGVSYRDSFNDYLKLTGVPADEAKDRATEIIYLYYDLAGYSDPLVLSGDKKYYDNFYVYTKEECEENLNNLTYEQLLYAAGYEGKIPDKVAIPDPNMFFRLDALFDDEHLQVWKDIATIQILNDHPVLLPEQYTQAGIEGVSIEKLTMNLVIEYAEMEISEIYVEKYFSEEDREIITRMCDDMVEEYRKLIHDADWLTDEGKSYLTNKLDHMQFFIGCGEPHEIDPADGDMIKDSLLQTIYCYSAYTQQENHDTLYNKKPFNGFDSMSPITVNACYTASTNSIVITAAIINEKVFDKDADYAWNLGAIGSIIGHEISHAFDSEGVLFDAYGNYVPDAMPKADIEAFKAKQETAIEYYNNFTVLGSHVDGKLTLAENFADISGLQCVLSICEDREAQKTALESYATVWRKLITDVEAKELLEIDEHSPSSVRVNAVVACFDEFYEIYGVKEGDPMYIEPEKRVRRW